MLGPADNFGSTHEMFIKCLISVEGIETSILREYLDNCVQFDGAPSESGFVINFEIKSLVPPGYIVHTSIGLMHLKGCQ